ncbi:dTDP-4-amino-4,6-dideoxygalactose transaminase [Krasilnikovia cinnamomea]|uniref:dTDP-4-amino-4,6-dideoxygalactose transaminase n=1 Tax=Krasilnikovia cinnamomea TaxID=349313 RepID=A0A4Q7Z9N6_9ACTN|nr:DegT/DnrJ/EryC1/StrS family aminotransferase [Krasilnikovia cinnamomea]RZU46573.1 dTDP-4-amino-4,6-dideoxygalactose transaminase [Krasilnikovia cinnamomea]
MTGDLVYDADHPVDDRYAPPDCGEIDVVAAVLADGRLSGGNPVLGAYERALADWFTARRAIAVNSGTSALHATLIALGVRAGDEVIVPATAPLPTAMPILTCGAIPVIVDTRPGELGMDPGQVAARLTARTKAAISLPLWGYPADDDPAAAVLAAADVPLIEDAAQAHGAVLRGRAVGTRYRAGCFSTHDRKLLSTGEGGFVLASDDELADRIDFYTHLGHLRGGHGVNYKLAAPLAAIGLRRLPGLAAQLTARRAIAAGLLAELPAQGSALAELVHAGQPNYYSLVLTAAADPGAAAAALTAAGLAPDSARYGYRPLYRQPLFAAYASDCPNAEALCQTALQFPVHPALPETAIHWAAGLIRALAREETPA